MPMHFDKGCEISVMLRGKTLQVEYRYLEGKEDHTPTLLAELLQLKIDVLVVISLSSIRAAKQATKTIPVVMATNFDPVASGFSR